VHTQVSALREVLPQQPIGILVRAALPRAVRIAEIDLHTSIDLDFPPWSGGVRSERHAAARMVIPSMLARASAGVR